MAVQSFDLEEVKKVQGIVEDFRGMFGKMASGLETAADVAEQTESTKMKENVKNAMEATVSITKTFEDMAQGMEDYVRQVAKLDAGING